jgi:prepilin-type N-terminal cleavage/methylation domain-containing protein
MCAVAERRRERGFSLVEVLCAVAIAASAIVVLSNGATSALRGARALDMHLGAQVILQSILEDELAAGDTAPAVRRGDSGPYRWTLAIEPASAGELPPAYKMYRLTGSVSWGRGGLASASVLKLAR